MGKLKNARRKPGATLEDLQESHWDDGRFNHRGEEYKVVQRGGRASPWIVRSVGGLNYRANVYAGGIELELLL